MLKYLKNILEMNKLYKIFFLNNMFFLKKKKGNIPYLNY